MKQEEIERLFPAVYREALRDRGPLRALIAVMEAMHERPEREVARLDATLDPLRTPDEFVPLLARWVDLGWLWTSAPVGPGEGPILLEHLGRLRELVASAAFLSRWRGTETGLLGFLQRATGRDDIELIEAPSTEDGRSRPFHVQVVLPADADEPRLTALVRRIVAMEKPAHLTYEIVFSNPTRS